MCCNVIGVRASNQDIVSALLRNKISANSKLCEQLAEMLGCYVPTDRTGFVRLGVFGPRGPNITLTNPIDQNLKCNFTRKARKFSC